MMTSMRRRLVLGTVIGMTLVLITSFTGIYSLVRQELIAGFDAGLIAEAGLLASTIELERGRVDVEFDDLDMHDFCPGGPSFLALWLADGELLYRSPSLAQHDPKRPVPDTATPTATWTREPWLATGRSVSIGFLPRLDEDEPDAGLTPPRVTLLLARDATALVASLNRILELIGAACLLSVLLTCGLLALIIRRSLKPLLALADTIARRSATNLAPISPGRPLPTELSPILARLNELLGSVAGTLERERTFSNDVAHELRTPLAGLRTTIEVALNRPRPGPEYVEALQESLGLTVDMESMVSSLLMLARLDAGMVAPEPRALDPSTLLADIWRPLEARTAQRELRCTVTLEPPPGPLESDPLLLSMLLRNLVQNAVQYATPGGHLRLESHGAGGCWRWLIENDAADPDPAQQDRLFERFWRGDDARSLEGGNHGLGLPLVQRLTEVLGLELGVDCQRGRFRVDVRLPLPPGPSTPPP